MCKLDMKNAYFSVPLLRNCRDKVRFHQSGKLYEFLSVFCLRTSPKNFYQNFRSANILNKEIEYQNKYLSRRHVVAGKVNQRGSDSNRQSDFLVATSRICNQPEKVHPYSPAENSFQVSQWILSTCHCLDSRETDESDQLMFGDVQNRESVHFTIDKAHRSFKFNSTSSVTCTTSVSVFTTNSCRIAQSRLFISTSSILDFQCKTGTSLVGPKPKTLQWKMSCTMCQNFWQ